VPIVRYADPIDALVERQQTLWLQQQGPVQAGVISGGGASRPTFTRATILAELRQRGPHHSQQTPPAQASSASSSQAGNDGGRRSDGSSSSMLAPGPPIVFRGVAALPTSLGISLESCADVERVLSGMTAATIQSIFEPPSLHLLRVLCPWEIGLAVEPLPSAAASAPGGEMEGVYWYAAAPAMEAVVPVLDAATVHHSRGSAMAQSSPGAASRGDQDN
jgi:hypothetical protein